MTIRKSVTMFSALIVLAVLLTGGLFLVLLQKNTEVEAAHTTKFICTQLVAELRASSEELTRQVRNYAVTGNPEAENAYNHVLVVRSGEAARPETAMVASGEKRALLDLMKEYGISDKEFEKVKLANDLSNALIALEVESMNAVKGIYKDADGKYTVNKEPDLALASKLVFSKEYIEETRKIMRPLDEFQSMVSARTLREVQRITDQQHLIAIIVGSALLIVLSACIGNGLYLSRKVTTPLTETTAFAEKVAHGDLESSIVVRSADEMGALRSTLNSLVSGMKSRIQEVEEISRQAQQKEQEALKMKTVADEALENVHSNEQRRQEIAGQLQQVVSIVSAAAGQLSVSIKNAEIGAEEQASQATSTAAAMDQMNASVHEVSSSADQAALVAEETRQRALKGSEVVKHVLESIHTVQVQSNHLSTNMQELGEQARSITQIMTVISDIADQTNLLALNAAIEAARAGDAGRGFAVVADEVRKLAEKTVESTTDVSRAINAIQGSVSNSITEVSKTVSIIGDTSELAKESGVVLASIVESITSVTQQVENISHSTREQSGASDDVAKSIGCISGIATNTVSEMNNATAAVAEVASQTEVMVGLTGDLQA